ncbi:hypothetical protein FB451DRAFT_1460797 [Mycena latifolia]|nr:hypothetical protein FB451DRAFT_1460797 [Mycena latifolia]
MLASIIFAAVLAATAQANHRITLRNNCPFKVSLTLSNFPPGGADYTGRVSKTLRTYPSLILSVRSRYWKYPGIIQQGHHRTYQVRLRKQLLRRDRIRKGSVLNDRVRSAPVIRRIAREIPLGLVVELGQSIRLRAFAALQRIPSYTARKSSCGTRL